MPQLTPNGYNNPSGEFAKPFSFDDFHKAFKGGWDQKHAELTAPEEEAKQQLEIARAKAVLQAQKTDEAWKDVHHKLEMHKTLSELAKSASLQGDHPSAAPGDPNYIEPQPDNSQLGPVPATDNTVGGLDLGQGFAKQSPLPPVQPPKPNPQVAPAQTINMASMGLQGNVQLPAIEQKYQSDINAAGAPSDAYTGILANMLGIDQDELSGLKPEERKDLTGLAKTSLTGQYGLQKAAAGSGATAILAPLATDPKVLAAMQAGTHGDEFLKAVENPFSAHMIRNISSYQQDPKSLSSRKGDQAAALTLAQQDDPTFDATKYQMRFDFQKKFTDPNGQTGAGLKSINTAVSHMGTLAGLAEALNNGDIPKVNALVNWVKNNTGDSSVNNFDTAGLAVAGEMAKAFKSNGIATDEEINNWKKTFSAEWSQHQLSGAVQTAVQLLAGRVHAQSEDWLRNMGKPRVLLDPETQHVLTQFGIDPKGVDPAIAMMYQPQQQPAAPGAAPQPATGAQTPISSLSVSQPAPKIGEHRQMKNGKSGVWDGSRFVVE